MEDMPMKMRFLAVLLLSAVLLVGCGNSTATKSGNTAVDTAAETEQKENLADMMETKEYSCTVDDSFMYYVMYVTNNSDKVVSIDLNVTALDSSGSMVGSSSDSTKAVAPGQTAGIWTTFDEWDKISSFDYTMSVNEEKDFSPVYDDLSIDYNTTDTGIGKGNQTSHKKDRCIWLL
jgi:archaellum component FlaF (FlaF/FlaG flagellin family)